MKRCPYCGTTIPYNDNYCYSCQRTFEDPGEEESSCHRLDLSKDEWRKPWASAGLSLVGIGLGQFYNGQLQRAAFVYFLWLVLVLISFSSRLLFSFSGMLIFVVSMLGFQLFVMIDAFIQAKKLQSIKSNWYNKRYFCLIIILINSFVIFPLIKSSTIVTPVCTL